MNFKSGDRVYHKNLKRYGTFLEYDWTGMDECHVEFDCPYGEDVRHVTSRQLILVKENNISVPIQKY